MNPIEYKITLDCRRAESQVTITAKQGEASGRKITFSLNEGRLPYKVPSGVTAVLRAKKPSGAVLYNTCTVTPDGNVEYIITTQTVAEVGKLPCELQLSQDGKVIFSPNFTLLVYKNLSVDSEVESSDEFTALQAAISRAENLTDGTTFTPTVSEDGVLSWTNDGGKANPEPVNIKGEDGAFRSYVLLIEGTENTKNNIDLTSEQVADLQNALQNNSQITLLLMSGNSYAAYYPIEATSSEIIFGKLNNSNALFGDGDVNQSLGRMIVAQVTIREGTGSVSFVEFDSALTRFLPCSISISWTEKADSYTLTDKEYAILRQALLDKRPIIVVRNTADVGGAQSLYILQTGDVPSTYNVDSMTLILQGLNDSIKVQMADKTIVPNAESDAPGGGGGGSTVELDTTLTQSGKAADAKAVGDALPAYKINLTKYSISADGTNATATTDGINQAIADAVAAGYGTIVFPKGEYLIAGSDRINITGRLTVDFNNSVLRKEANSNESYVMVEISGDHNVVKNATLYGDRETHDYSSGGTHEWGIGIYISPDSRFTIIENMDVFDTTGYGMCTGTAYNQIEPIRDRPLEAGCYDKETGGLVESTTHTVLGYTLDITDRAIRNNMFILGGNGYCAHGITEPMSFYMTYYDENETYIGFSRAYRLYDNIDLKSLLYWYPTLRYIKFSIENTDTETNVTLELRSSYTSDDITIKNCEIARCRTLGIAITGGKRILVENVSIHDIGGAAPGYGVDIEDGYQLNQYIAFRSCEFYNNKFGNIIVVKARDVLVENCRFQGFERPEGGTAAPTGISAYGTITSKFVVRDSVFTGCSTGGEKFYLYNCIFIDCPDMEGDFTECRFHGCQIMNKYGTTLNRCYLNGTTLRYRNGNFGCYDSVLENVKQWDENWDTGNLAEFWVMEGCLLKKCGPTPKTGVPYIRIANNTVYNGTQVGSNNNCLEISTKQKTHCQIVGNTFEQGGKDSIVNIYDTYGSDVYLEGNVFKSLLTSADAVVNADRVSCACTGRVSFNANTFDIGYMVASLPVLDLENCVKATLTNNKFLGNYGVPIRMTSVTEAICDGNEYTGTPVLAENCKGVDIPNACSKSYVDGLIGDVNTVIASINSVVGGA